MRRLSGQLGAALLAGLFAACASSTANRKDEPISEGDLSPRNSAGAASAQTPDLPEAARARGAAGKSEPQEERKLLDPSVRAAFDEAVKTAVAGDPQAAIVRFKHAATSDKRTYWAHYNLGLLYERTGELADAEREYLIALDQRPKADRAAENYAKLMVRSGRTERALDELRRRIAATPDAVGLRIALGYALSSAVALDAAAIEIKKVLKVDEQNVSAMFVLASVYHRQSKPELAMMVLDNAEQIDKSRAEIANLQGVILLGQKKKAAALERFRRAASLRADFPEAHTNLGAMLLSAQSFPEAARELELAIRFAPNLAAAHLDLGSAYRGTGSFEKSKEAYQTALKLDPKLAPDVYFNMGVLYADADLKDVDPIQRNEEALAYFKKVKDAGRGDEAVDQYVKDAKKAIEKEQRRRERDEKDKLRKQKKAEEAAKQMAEAEKNAAEAASAEKAAAGNRGAAKAGTAASPPGAPSKKSRTQGKIDDQ